MTREQEALATAYAACCVQMRRLGDEDSPEHDALNDACDVLWRRLSFEGTAHATALIVMAREKREEP